MLDVDHPHYRWVALSNTTLGMLMATSNASIVLISLPAIFRGIGLDPLAPGNISYLLWMIMGYLLVTAVLVVTLGRLGDMFGRVRMYNLGFVVFTVGLDRALARPVVRRRRGAMWLIGWRIVQGVGGAMLIANSTAILTDAFPAQQRGMALGINQIAGDRRQLRRPDRSAACWPRSTGGSVFWVNVPIGLFGTVWAYRSAARDRRAPAGRIDWRGNVTFAVGLIGAARRHHLRHPALRRPHHGLDQPVGARRPDRRRRPAGRLLRHRDAGRRADVPPRAVPDPRLRRRQPRRPAGRRSAAAACSSC